MQCLYCILFIHWQSPMTERFGKVLSKSGSGSALLPMALVLASHLLLKDQQQLKWCILEANRMVNNQGVCNINIVMFCHLGLL